MSLYYLDSSALVKLVRDEPESLVLRRFLADADLLCCDLALVEVPRAVRRAAELDPRLPATRLIARAGELLDAVVLLPLDRGLLAVAGALVTPGLRTLDAIHVAAAVDAHLVDAFVSYDERQSAAARLVGLRTFAPRS